MVNEKVKFLGPDEKGIMGGILSSVKEIVRYKEICFEHYGMVLNGEEKTNGEDIDDWVPSFEKYIFLNIGENKILLKVEVELSKKWSVMMNAMWPKALNKLKEICEK